MIGQIVSHYKIGEKLGEGGMGVVYKAQDLMLDRPVALKFLNARLNTSDQDRSRFLREARAASALDHPNICTIHEVGATPDGRMFIAMAHYDGITLKEKIGQGPLVLDEAVSIATQIALGLQTAHEKGVIHRDIKSANIILTATGQIKIMDFGLAKFAGRSQITAEASQLGTLAYMSPEQARGREADQRSDIWSLGMVMYEMVTGVLPFASEYDQALLYAIINETPPPPSQRRHDLPKGLEQAILRCLQRNPEERYQDAGGLLNDLFRFRPGPTAHAPAPESPHWRKKLVIVAGSLLLLAALGYFSRFFFATPRIQQNVVVVEVAETANGAQEGGKYTAEMLEYLIADEVLQSSNAEVLRRDEFGLLYHGRQPEMDISVTLERQPIGYSAHVMAVGAAEPSSFSLANGRREEFVIQVRDLSALLTKVLPDIRERVVRRLARGDLRHSTFTSSWDAFVWFYRGLRYWRRLEIPQAKLCFNSALRLDSTFVLAKLRLAEAYRFEASQMNATAILKSVRPSLGLLSRVDSMKAEALTAGLEWRLDLEASIRREIYQIYPLRIESAFDVAEAYYWLCDIPTAIEYYDSTLAIDGNFAKAHNHLGYCYLHLGQHSLALKHFRRYLELDSTANAFDSMGDGYMAAGNLDSAVWAKERGLAVDSTLSYMHWAMIFIRLREGRLEDAAKAVVQYMNTVYGPDDRARGYAFKGFVEYARGNYVGALRYCQQSHEMFDTTDIATRSHELHWLLGLVYMKLGDMKGARQELVEMESILRANNVSATNYRMYIYKYKRHLEACLAARQNDIVKILEIGREFDESLRSKVADHGSPFDYAYFSTALGELLANPPLNRTGLATKQFEQALGYNPHYAPAHYNLWKIYRGEGKLEQARKELKLARELWKDADESFLKSYGLFP